MLQEAPEKAQDVGDMVIVVTSARKIPEHMGRAAYVALRRVFTGAGLTQLVCCGCIS